MNVSKSVSIFFFGNLQPCWRWTRQETITDTVIAKRTEMITIIRFMNSLLVRGALSSGVNGWSKLRASEATKNQQNI